MLAPPAFAVHQLAKHLPAFHAQYPKVTIELVAPGPVESLDEAFDVTILSVARRPLDGDRHAAGLHRHHAHGRRRHAARRAADLGTGLRAAGGERQQRGAQRGGADGADRTA